MSFQSRALLAACAGLTVLSACGDDQGPAGTDPVTINFAAAVNGAPFACGQAYNNIGASNTTVTPQDFRLYVSNVRLLTASGAEVPVTLDESAPWQHSGAALVDFEDGAPGCPNGTAELRTQVTGTAARGNYTGLRFTLGLPFAVNHQDPATAASPFDLTEMFWVWQYGYKFLRLDVTTTGQPNGWFVHLGSNGCSGGSATQPPTSCALPNRPDITLATFDAATDTVVADIGALFAAANLDSDTPNTAPGCMSDNTDPECITILPGLGVSLFDGSTLPTQTLFRRSGP